MLTIQISVHKDFPKKVVLKREGELMKNAWGYKNEHTFSENVQYSLYLTRWDPMFL